MTNFESFLQSYAHSWAKNMRIYDLFNLDFYLRVNQTTSKT